MANMLKSLAMARRPNYEKPDVMSKEDLKRYGHHPSLLSYGTPS
jgi:hypothetical protein